MIDAAVKVPDLVADEPLRIGMAAPPGRRGLDALDPSISDGDLQRAGVGTIHGARRANPCAHSRIVTRTADGSNTIQSDVHSEDRKIGEAVGGASTITDIADSFNADADEVFCGYSSMYLPNLAIHATQTDPD